MRLGVIADVHGNLPALETVMQRLSQEGVDQYLCAGDLVGYGPWPNECIELTAASGVVCVAGNHDLMAIGRLPLERCGRLAESTLRWTTEVLEAKAREYLARLPLETIMGEVVVAHGSLGDPRRYAFADAAPEQLGVLERRHPAAGLLVLGHTHRSLSFGHRSGVRLDSAVGSVPLPRTERHLLNPGSVGQSRERAIVARYMVLDLERRSAAFHAISYDHLRCRRALRREGLPRRSYHRDPRGARARVGRLRRALIRGAARR